MVNLVANNVECEKLKMNKYQVYENAELCNEELEHMHLEGFAKSFIKNAHMDRWINMLTVKRKNLYKNSSKLENHLDKTHCILVSKATDKIPQNAEGMYFDFIDRPIIVTHEVGYKLGGYADAIFSLEAGKYAYYFSHEGRAWLCTKLPD